MVNRVSIKKTDIDPSLSQLRLFTLRKKRVNKIRFIGVIYLLGFVFIVVKLM